MTMRLAGFCGLLSPSPRWAPSRRSQLERHASAPRRARSGTVPAFSLTDQQGRQVTDRDLLRHGLGGELRVHALSERVPAADGQVQGAAEQAGRGCRTSRSCRSRSIPSTTRPQVLAAYADRFEADPERWQFLTGPLERHREDRGAGLQDPHAADPSRAPTDPSLVEIMHGEHFVLVDARA